MKSHAEELIKSVEKSKGSLQNIDGEIELIGESAEKSKGSIPEMQENTRANIAKIFVYGFFALLFAALVIIPLYNAVLWHFTKSDALFIKLTDVLTLIGSIVGTSLGFITGYYFKISDKNDY